MTQAPEMPSPLACLSTPADYAAARSTVFPSETSVRWAIRQHRQALIAGGAFKLLNGRVFISPAAFDAVMMKVGQRAVLDDWRVNRAKLPSTHGSDVS